MLRVAPVLTHHHLQNVEQVLASKKDMNPYLVSFTNALASITKAAGLMKELRQFKAPDDRWVQDFVTQACLVRMEHQAGVGVVQHLGINMLDIDAGGNIEAVPLYTFDGKTWQAGRLIHGDNGIQSHHILSYLEAQETQKPLLLDTFWLAVGHVDDEFL
ncbi:uncharacterized protein FFB14_07142 [Fusarium fujikuroi]|nr:uncharacterized protein FFB14_07142 [Fusarium fujikuroi]